MKTLETKKFARYFLFKKKNILPRHPGLISIIVKNDLSMHKK
jgi:hypothetical protein